MPTVMHWYNMAAQKFGDVDPTNAAAVEIFFTETLSSLPDKTRQKVVKYLLGHDGPARGHDGPARVPPTCVCSACEKTRERTR